MDGLIDGRKDRKDGQADRWMDGIANLLLIEMYCNIKKSGQIREKGLFSDGAFSFSTFSPGTDFTVVVQSLTFSSDDTRLNISVGIQDDNITEGNEAFLITLSAMPFDEDQSAVAQMQQVVLDTIFSTVTINIVDDDG